MKIVHFECGLGNQLTCYANYLLVKRQSKDDAVFIENLVYSIDRKGMGFNQWNGFELETVFGIRFDNIIDYVDDRNALLSCMEQEYSRCQGQNNSYSAWCSLNKCGVECQLAGIFRQDSPDDGIPAKIRQFLRRLIVSQSKSGISYSMKRHIYTLLRKFRKHSTPISVCKEGDYFYPLSFDVMKDISSIKLIEPLLKSTLVFPPVDDERNKNILRMIEDTNSVSIHARRTDFLQYNSDCYRYGYFKKAVKYIKKHVTDPVFFVFSDDCEWCRENLDEIGLSSDDEVHFVDWNKGKSSYRDMQLMSVCKHNINTKSSFGWWASFLNSNPDKIIVTQVSEYYSKVYL